VRSWFGAGRPSGRQASQGDAASVKPERLGPQKKSNRPYALSTACGENAAIIGAMNETTDTEKSSRLESLLAKRELIERRLKAMAAQQNAARRKAEARAKFLLGAVVLKRALHDNAVLKQFCTELPSKDQALVQDVVARFAQNARA
jgi:hypothetical protein